MSTKTKMVKKINNCLTEIVISHDTYMLNILLDAKDENFKTKMLQ